MFSGLLRAGLGLFSMSRGRKGKREQVGAINQGFDYLKDNDVINQAQSMGQTGLNRAMVIADEMNPLIDDNFFEAREDFSNVAGLRAGLLGMGDPANGERAFQRFRDSTGYQFRLGEGMRAIEGSAAARGVLNSGATLKGLQTFGQNMGSQEFQNFLNQVSEQGDMQLQEADLVSEQARLRSGQASLYGAQADAGLRAAMAVGDAGGQAGRAAAEAMRAGDQNEASGLGGLVQGITSIFS